MKVSESLSEFVEDSVTRVRLGECCGSTCRLPFSKFAEGYLPHGAVVPDLPSALVVVASIVLSLDRTQEHV